jgi:hypothetical protein
MLFLLRFFRTVPPVPSLMHGTFAVVVVTAALATAADPGRTTQALVPLLLLQVFAAASGFAGPARRGHYDLLLTRGEGRLRIALAHWTMSIAPGLASWIAVGLAETLVRGRPDASFATGTVAAMWLVSTLPWALTVALPRFAGAIGWLLLLSLAGIFAPLSAVPPVVEATLVPTVLLGRRLAPEDLPLVLPGAALGLVAMMAACTWIQSMSIPLESGQ